MHRSVIPRSYILHPTLHCIAFHNIYLGWDWTGTDTRAMLSVTSLSLSDIVSPILDIYTNIYGGIRLDDDKLG